MIRTIAGGVDVVTAGTAVALASVRTSAVWVSVQAKTANTGRIFVGGSSVGLADFGVELSALDEYTFPTGSAINMYELTTIFIDATVDGDGATVLFATK